MLLGDKFGHRLLHTVSEAGEHSRTTGQDDVGVEVLPELMSNITPPDGVIKFLISGCGEPLGMLKKSQSALEPLVAAGDHLAVGKLVGGLQRCGRVGGLPLLHASTSAGQERQSRIFP